MKISAKIHKAIIALTALTAALGAGAELREGTFRNPVMWADVPDPDVIRVGDDFYMVSTTMHLMPGCPVMHSKDLVNWEIVNYVYPTLNDTPRYNLEDGTVYGKGQWATSIRFVPDADGAIDANGKPKGKYWLLFSPNDEPYRSYIYTATNPTGEWTLVSRPRHFHDASLFFDDDGRVYVFYDGGTIRVRELNADLSDVKEGGVDQPVIFQDEVTKGLHEGTRVIKHNGKYYALVINWPAGGARRQLCYRADSVTGPYERQTVLLSDFGGFPPVGQGTIVDDPDGNWWGMIFQDRGGVGRVLTLNPCRWIDGWPMLGDENGKVPAVVKKKLDTGAKKAIVKSDDFKADTLDYVWEWNHNPVNSAWSLNERRGFLRLHTSKVVENLYLAPNTLGQRMEGPECTGVVKLDLSHMKPGDVAGFGAFNGDSGLLSVVCGPKGKKRLDMIHSSMSLTEPGHKVGPISETVTESVALKKNTVYLKINTDFRPGRDIATFAYSLDGKKWTALGKPFKMIYDYRRMFMGTRYAIYNYATSTLGGYVDVDSFTYSRNTD